MYCEGTAGSERHFLYTCTNPQLFRRPIFIQIVNDLNLHFQVKYLNWLHLKIDSWLSRKRWQIGKLCHFRHRKSHVTFRLPYLHLTLAYSNCQGQGLAHLDCKYLANSSRYYRAEIVTPTNRMSHTAFQLTYLHLKVKIMHILTYLELTLTYFKCQLVR